MSQSGAYTSNVGAGSASTVGSSIPSMPSMPTPYPAYPVAPARPFNAVTSHPAPLEDSMLFRSAPPPPLIRSPHAEAHLPQARDEDDDASAAVDAEKVQAVVKPMSMTKQALLGFLMLVIIGSVSYGVYWWWTHYIAAPKSTTTPAPATATTTAAVTAPAASTATTTPTAAASVPATSAAARMADSVSANPVGTTGTTVSLNMTGATEAIPTAAHEIQRLRFSTQWSS